MVKMHICSHIFCETACPSERVDSFEILQHRRA